MMRNPIAKSLRSPHLRGRSHGAKKSRYSTQWDLDIEAFEDISLEDLGFFDEIEQENLDYFNRVYAGAMK